MNIYVGNLSYGVSEEDLKGVFEEYGSVDSVKIIKDKLTGRSKGFGFVEMTNNEEGQRAIEELNQAELDNRTMRVNEARERDNSNNRSDFRSNNNRYQN